MKKREWKKKERKMQKQKRKKQNTEKNHLKTCLSPTKHHLYLYNSSFLIWNQPQGKPNPSYFSFLPFLESYAWFIFINANNAHITIHVWSLFIHVFLFYLFCFMWCYLHFVKWHFFFTCVYACKQHWQVFIMFF